jgi:two-component system response regulator VanR
VENSRETKHEANNALLIEDDGDDRLTVRLLLEVMGFTVYETPSAIEARELFALRDYSLAVIHIGHAPLVSLELCRWVRAESTVPILMLTKRGEVVDEEMVMNAGADDYVSKPIDEKIFTSRVLQQLKRGQSQRAPRATIISWRNLEMDLTEHSFKVGGKIVDLTNTEYQFLQLLMENPNRVFSREQILDTIGSLRGSSSDQVVDSHASRIRKKIRENGGPEVISVIRSVGFRLADPLAE